MKFEIRHVLAWKVINYYNNLPRIVMDSPSLGILKLEMIDFLRETVPLVPIGVNSKKLVPCVILGKHL